MARSKSRSRKVSKSPARAKKTPAKSPAKKTPVKTPKKSKSRSASRSRAPPKSETKKEAPKSVSRSRSSSRSRAPAKPQATPAVKETPAVKVSTTRTGRSTERRPIATSTPIRRDIRTSSHSPVKNSASSSGCSIKWCSNICDSFTSLKRYWNKNQKDLIYSFVVFIFLAVVTAVILHRDPKVLRQQIYTCFHDSLDKLTKLVDRLRPPNNA